jgi:hypothetical protein
LFFVKPAVCCVYLNRRELITLARCPIGSNWSSWLQADHGDNTNSLICMLKNKQIFKPILFFLLLNAIYILSKAATNKNFIVSFWFDTTRIGSTSFSSRCAYLCNLSTLSVPDEGYSRNTCCALNLISTFY